MSFFSAISSNPSSAGLLRAHAAPGKTFCANAGSEHTPSATTIGNQLRILYLSICLFLDDDPQTACTRTAFRFDFEPNRGAIEIGRAYPASTFHAAKRARRWTFRIDTRRIGTFPISGVFPHVADRVENPEQIGREEPYRRRKWILIVSALRDQVLHRRLPIRKNVFITDNAVIGDIG